MLSVRKKEAGGWELHITDERFSVCVLLLDYHCLPLIALQSINRVPASSGNPIGNGRMGALYLTPLE